jgi:hypothetical protein
MSVKGLGSMKSDGIVGLPNRVFEAGFISIVLLLVII